MGLPVYKLLVSPDQTVDGSGNPGAGAQVDITALHFLVFIVITIIQVSYFSTFYSCTTISVLGPPELDVLPKTARPSARKI